MTRIGWSSVPFSPPSTILSESPSLKRKQSWHEVIWLVFDILWSSVVVAPLVVMYWRGTWDLLEDFVSESF